MAIPQQVIDGPTFLPKPLELVNESSPRLFKFDKIDSD